MKNSILNLGKALTTKEQQQISGGLYPEDCRVQCENGVCWEVEDADWDKDTIYNGC